MPFTPTQVEMFIFFTAMYNRDNKNLNFLLSSPVPKEILIKQYQIFVKFYELTKIEDLPKEKKEELCNKCRETGLFFSNRTLKDSAAMLHAINFVNERG